MIYKNNNKKAQIDSTLTWFLAIFIIMFILIVFLTMTFLMADKKFLTGGDDITQSGIINDPGITENLFAILNSEIQNNGKSEKVINAVMNYSSEFLVASKIKGIDSKEVKQIHESNKEIVLSIRALEKSFCNDSSLLTPFGLINSNYFLIGQDEKTNDYLIRDIDESKYSPIVTYNIIYNGINIKIKFKQPKNCSLNVINGVK